MEIFYKMSRLVDFDELWSKQVSVVFFNENEGFDLIRQKQRLKMWFIWQKACVYKGNFDRISFAVQAPPVCKLSHTVVLFGLKLWFLLKNLWFLKITLIKFCLQSKSRHIRPLSHLNFDLKLTEPWDVMFTFQNNVFLGHFEVQCRNWISRMGELKDWGPLGAGKVQTKFIFFWLFASIFK